MTDAEHAELQGYREQHLLKLMRRISEDLYSAGWLTGLERILFRYAFQQLPGGTTIMPLESMQLRYLATESQCWWHWPDGADEEQKISLDEARRLYG